jgi:arabinan endo-1,5-alpha-L-arabinosidase
MLSHLASCSTFCLGKGSFWGSPDALFDDVILYDRVLSGTEVIGLTSMASRVYDFRVLDPTGIESVSVSAAPSAVFDLQGRRVHHPLRGLYVKDGRKIFFK